MKISIKRDILWNIQSFSSMNAYDNMHNEIFFKIVNDLDDKLNVSLNEIERRLRTPLF
jgi:hypothetical protein